MGADNQAERAIEMMEFMKFIADVLRAKDVDGNEANYLARCIIEAIRSEGRRWSV